MKKYTQITIVLGVFFLIFILRTVNNEKSKKQVLGNSYNSAKTQANPVPENNSSNTGMIGNGQMNKNMRQRMGTYKDGSYTGSRVDAFYGFIQVRATVQDGRLSNIEFLEYPNDNPTSIMINQQAMPILTTEAISKQNAQVDIVSGASDSAIAFQKSLADALNQAR